MVFFQPKQNAKTPVKRLSCFRQSQTGVRCLCKLLSMMLSIKL